MCVKCVKLFKPIFSTKYGGKHRVVLIHGDGTGPEMMVHIKEAFKAVGAPVDFEDIELNRRTACDYFKSYLKKIN